MTDAATLTIGLPVAHRNWLTALAAWRGRCPNNLMEELSIRALTEHDTELRFRIRATYGDAGRALHLLDKLDRRYSSPKDT